MLHHLRNWIESHLFHLLLMINILNINYTYSQIENSKVEVISLEHGLSQANVRCILQDKNGFMWFGTQDGLNRFDGYEFAKFNFDSDDLSSLPGNLVSTLIEDNDGNIWIGTMGGLAVYDPYKNYLKRINTGFKDDRYPTNISSIFLNKNGYLLIGDYSLGLFIYDIKNNKYTESKIHKINEKNFEENKITSLLEDKNGTIWIGTFSQGIIGFNQKTNRIQKYKVNLATDTSLSSNYITALCIDDDNIYIGTTNGLNVLNIKNGKIKKYFYNKSLKGSISSNHILSIHKDKFNFIWIGTENGGLNLFNKDTEQFMSVMHEQGNREGLSENTIFSIYRDNSNNLWIGTSGSGLNKISLFPEKFKSISRKGMNKISLDNYVIRSIMIDKDENLWLGTDFGLYIINKTKDKVKSYFFDTNDEKSINDNKVWAITQSENGEIWIGTQRGLAKYNKESDNFSRIVYMESHTEKLPVFIIRSLYVDKNNIIWIGTFGEGLFSYSPADKKFVNHSNKIFEKENLKELVIFQIYEDIEQNLWLVAPSGLACYSPIENKYRRFFSGEINDNPSEYIPLYALIELEKGSFWLSTLGKGFLNFNSHDYSYKVFNAKNGLVNNVVYSLLPDKKQNLWIATNKGISKFNMLTNSFTNYDMHDGLPGNEFNTGAYFIDNAGFIYFGSTEGLVYFHPDSIKENNIPLNIAITNFKIFDKVVSLNKIYFMGEEIELSFKDNYFSLEFSCLDFRSPNKNQYSYFLEGYDKDWIQSGKRRYASYTNLDASTYKFWVKAINNEGQYNNSVFFILITIKPPFWQTWWFRFFIVTTFLAIITVLYFKRISHFREIRLAQERFSRQLIDSQELERKRIASELHDGLGQELLTIINRAKISLKKPDIYPHANQLSEIVITATNSIEEVRRIARNLHPYQLDSLGLTKTLESLIKKFSDSTGIQVIVNIDSIDDIFPIEKEINIFRILQEGINNVIKHSKAKKVHIKIQKEETKLLISLKDDGIGIKNELMEEIMNKKTGFGLMGIQERVKYLNGTFILDSNTNMGTKIVITIPIGK